MITNELKKYLLYNDFYLFKDQQIFMKKLTVCEHCGRCVTLEISLDGNYEVWDERGFNLSNVPKEYICKNISEITDAENLIKFLTNSI